MKDYTELVFILDRSGSMSGLENDTIGGVNSVLDEHKAMGDDALVTTVLFDHKTQMICEREKISKVKHLTRKEYYVRGCTALLDAVGSTIRTISAAHKTLPKHHRPAHTIVVITTDGMENASKTFSYGHVKKLIEKKQGKGWEFIFMGANIDAAAEAANLGIAEGHAVTYRADSAGSKALYQSIACATSAVRACGVLTEDWADAVVADRRARG